MRLLTPLLVVLVLCAAVGPALAVSPGLTATVTADDDGWLYDITAYGATGEGALAWQGFQINDVHPYTPDSHYDPAGGNWFGFISTAPGWYAIGAYNATTGTSAYAAAGMGANLAPNTSVSGFQFWRPFADGWIDDATVLWGDSNGGSLQGSLDFGVDPGTEGAGGPPPPNSPPGPCWPPAGSSEWACCGGDGRRRHCRILSCTESRPQPWAALALGRGAEEVETARSPSSRKDQDNHPRPEGESAKRANRYNRGGFLGRMPPTRATMPNIASGSRQVQEGLLLGSVPYRAGDANSLGPRLCSVTRLRGAACLLEDAGPEERGDVN